MEELSVQDAVRIWAQFDQEHRGCKGKWADYNHEEGSILRMGCPKCLETKVLRVYLEEANPILSSAPVL